MNISAFARGTEKMIDPMMVGKTHYMQTRLKKLPRCLQRKIVTSATKKASQMGFVVEPYAFFLFYEIPDPLSVQHLLPDHFVPVKSHIFQGDEAKYYGIASVFRLHTSAFWGARAEFYVIAKNLKTGQMSWVILDYISDTISYDFRHGLRSPDATNSVVTTTCEGNLIADLVHNKDGRRLTCKANLNSHKTRTLNEKLWIEGNTSIAYGRSLSQDNGDLFSLTFLPKEMLQAWEIPIKDVKVERITWYPEIFKGKLTKAACFPFAQHMLSDRPGNCTHYGSKKALSRAARSVKF